MKNEDIKKKLMENLSLVEQNKFLINNLIINIKKKNKGLLIPFKEYEKQYLTSKNSTLEIDEKIVFCELMDKNNKIFAIIDYDISSKKYIVYLNSIKILIKKKYNIFSYCEKCNNFYDKDEMLYHLLVYKHSISKKIIEIKCLFHNKYCAFVNVTENKYYCEDCIINTNIKLIPLISKSSSKIIYSNNDIFIGNLIQNKKEGISTYYYNDSSIFIGNFKDDFVKLPGIYKDINGKSIVIYEEWGDIKEFKIIQNLIKNEKLIDDLNMFLKIGYEKKIYSISDFNILIFINYNTNKSIEESIILIKNNFDSKLKRKDLNELIDLINKNISLKKIQNIYLLPILKKGIKINLENYLKDNNDFSNPLFINNNKEIIIFYFPEETNHQQIIETKKKVSNFNLNNNNCLSNFSIYFIINEEDPSNHMEIISKLDNYKTNLNIKNTFINFYGLINIFENSKYDTEPYFLIINKENVIIKTGLINSFERKFLNLNHINTPNKNFSKNKSELLDLLRNCMLNLSYNPNFRLEILYTFKTESNELSLISNSKLKCYGKLREKEYDSFKKKLLEILPEQRIKLGKLNTIDFDIDNLKEECFNCKKNLNKNKEIYCCLWCNIAFCEECVEEKIYNNKNEGFDKLIHKEHNLLYFKTRNKMKFSNIDSHKLGENLFYDIPQSEWSMKHNFICNGCLKQPENTTRFLCLNCRPGAIIKEGYIDFCYECIKHLRNKDKICKIIENTEDEEIKMLNNPNIGFKHKHDEHVYLNIIFNATDDYYEI